MEALEALVVGIGQPPSGGRKLIGWEKKIFLCVLFFVFLFVFV